MWKRTTFVDGNGVGHAISRIRDDPCGSAGKSVGPWDILYWGLGFRVEGRPLGHVSFSLIEFKRISFRKVFQRVFRALLGNLSHVRETLKPAQRLTLNPKP